MNHQQQQQQQRIVFYISELRGLETRGRVRDYGLLDSPRPPAIGMDRMHTKSRLRRFLIEFANGSTMHGLNHLAAPRRHPCERYLVGLIILGALGGLIGISLDSWYRYQHESTMLVLDNNFRKFEIAKPAITICPINLVDEEKFPEVFRRYNVSDTLETRKFLLSLANLTYENAKSAVDANFAAVEPAKWLRLLYELRGSVDLDAQYSDDFAWVSTERGLCVMFASNIAEYASVEHWLYGKLPDSIKRNKKKAFFNINNYGVVGAISSKSHDFWMYVHYPDTIVDYTTTGRIVRRVTLNSLTLGIGEVGSSERARLLTARQRNCKLNEDGGLAMWSVYSSNMCRLECRYGASRRLCGCLPHFARPMESVPTCTARQLHCIADRANEIVSLKTERLRACGCLEDCNEALYIDKESTSFALKEGSPPDAIINLNIDFPQVKYIHEELFGLTDFLASIGGAAGLFLGASVLSFCEIFYYATLRLLLYCIEKQGGRRKKDLFTPKK